MYDPPTPMMAQYLEIKSKYKDALLFYRMGDFYELFFDDAKIASEILDITLTHRGRHEGLDIPMCGVPVHSHESYLHKLIETGRHIAICEQMEDPAEAKKRGAKSVVKREVVRLVTPGTLTEDNLLSTRAHNYLAAYVKLRDEEALAWSDISTGEFFVSTVDNDLQTKLAAIAPNEIIIPQGFDLEPLTELVPYITPIARASFEVDGSTRRLCALYGIASLDALAPYSSAQISAMGAIVDYLSITQLNAHQHLRKPEVISAGGQMQIDAATRRNLELISALSGGKTGSLLHVIDKTITAIGGRRFEDRLRCPLCDLDVINMRQNHIEVFANCKIDPSDIRDLLRQTPDIERAFTRLVMGRGGPRDLRVVGDAIASANQLGRLIFEVHPTLGESLAKLEDIGAQILREISQNPPTHAREGGFLKAGIFEPLDQMRLLRDNTRGFIAQTQAEYIAHSGVSALKIKFNNVLGYFIEVPSTHAAHMLSPDMATLFIHRQTTANAIRFTTTELNSLQSKILSATDEAIQFEMAVFNEWLARIVQYSHEISSMSDALGELDIIQSQLHHIENGWSKPAMSADTIFDINLGRHPVVEASMRQQGQDFIANSCNLSKDPVHLWLITGPNMAGKSTFLRQNAIIAIMAQCGFYVPALSAKIGIIDKIFSRIGAADDLARGRSTFMVEMIETAAILNQSTEKSLVILDEIGRGTATYDGLAIAWSVLEYLLAKIKCRGLFATHFHELTELEQNYQGLYSAHVAIREWNDEIIFLHEVREGAALRSYGVDVAKLAGLPQDVVARARNLLSILENKSPAHQLGELPLFELAPSPQKPLRKSEALAQLRAVDGDFLSPKEALDMIYGLINLAKSEKDL